MKRPFLLCTLILFSFLLKPSLGNTFDGFVYPKDEVSHFDNEVLFSKLTPSYALNTTYTNESEYYKSDIKKGFYRIQFSKKEFSRQIHKESVLLANRKYDDIYLYAVFETAMDSLPTQQSIKDNDKFIKAATDTLNTKLSIASDSTLNATGKSNKEVVDIKNPSLFSTIPALVFNEDDSLIILHSFLLPYASDAAYPDSTMHLNLKAGLHTNSIADSNFNVIKPFENWYGLDSLQLIATNGSLADTSSIPIYVLPVNDGPRIQNRLSDQRAFANSFFSFTFPANVFYDPDPGDILNYSVSAIDDYSFPDWLNFEAVTANFSGTPGPQDIGVISIKLTATDDSSMYITDTFNIEIFDVNNPPFISNIPGFNIYEDDSLIIKTADWYAYVSDPEHADSLLSFYLKSSENISTFIDSNNILIKPVNNWYGTESLQLKVSDGEFSDSLKIEITILPVNDAPRLLNPLLDQQALENSNFIFSFPENTFYDADATDRLSYSSSLVNSDSLPSWLNFNSKTLTFSGTPDSNDTGIIRIKIVVSDDSSAYVSDTLNIKILHINQAPLLSAIPDLAFYEDDSLIYPFEIFYLYTKDQEQPDTILDFLILPAENIYVNSDSNKIILKAAENWFGKDSLQLIVSDGTLSDTSFIKIIVQPVNDRPQVLHPIENQQTYANTFFSFTLPANVFNDSDQTDSLHFTASSVDSNPLPLWLNFDSASGYFSGIPDTNHIGIIGIRITAADDSLSWVTADFNIEVFEINEAPLISNMTGLVFNEDDSLIYSTADWYPFVSDLQQADSMLNFHLQSATYVNAYADSNNIILTATENWFGQESLNLIVSDGQLSDTAQISITVLPVNDPPEITNLPDSIIVYKDSVITFSMNDYVSDVETADSLLRWSFETSSDSLKINWDSSSTRLSLQLVETVPRVSLIYTVIDDSMLSTIDTIIIKIAVISKITKQIELAPSEYILHQNYPNPFNASTQIEIYIPESEFVSLKIYNILGQEVKSLVSETLTPGSYTYFWDATNFSSGIYYYKLETGSGFVQVKRSVLMK